jgi:hypothetical protein
MKKVALALLLLCRTCVFSQTKIVPLSNGDLAQPLNTAISSCSSTLGCDLEIVPFSRAVLLNSVVIINKSNVTIHCDTSAQISTNYSSTPFNSTYSYWYGVFDVSAANNVEISGCSFNVTSLGTTAVDTIHVWGSQNVKIHNDSITSSVAPVYPSMLGIRAEGSSALPSVNVKAFGNVITVPSIGLSVGDNGQHVDYYENTVTNSFQCFDFNGSGGGSNPDAYDIDFHNNSCNSDYSSNYVESAADVRIRNNTFWQDASSGQPVVNVHNTSTANNELHIDISGNLFQGGATSAYAAHFFQNANHWTFSHNRVRNMKNDGLLIDSTSGSPIFGEIVGNQFVDNGQAGPSGNYCGIRLHQSMGNNVGYLTISTNQFVDDQGAHTELYPACSDGGQAPFYLKYTDNQNHLANQQNLPVGCSTCLISGNFP